MHLIATIALSLFIIVGCKDPAAGVSKAEVHDVTKKAPTPEPEAQGAGEVLQITAENSSIGWIGAKLTISQEGGFAAFSGTVQLDAKNLEASKIEISIDAASIYTDSDRLTAHLKSEDFLSVDTFPKAGFRSTSIVAVTEGTSTHKITGDFNIRGVTHSISFPATVKLEDSRLTAQAEFSFDRQQFGIAYTGAKDDLISDDVVLKLRFELPRD